MSMKTHFTPALFKFLRELEANNDREWFNANKERYLNEVRGPVQDFIQDFGKHLAKINPYFRADPRPSGGSMFRIYRDVRFAKDKRPYKTHVGILFRHKDATKAQDPGYYLHLAPGRIFAGAGTWHTDRDSITAIRERIVAHPKNWKSITSAKSFKGEWSFGGESLKRAPKGFDIEHPLIEDIRRKDFFVRGQMYTQREVCNADFSRQLAQTYKKATPLMQFLTTAIGLEW